MNKSSKSSILTLAAHAIASGFNIYTSHAGALDSAQRDSLEHDVCSMVLELVSSGDAAEVVQILNAHGEFAAAEFVSRVMGEETPMHASIVDLLNSLAAQSARA